MKMSSVDHKRKIRIRMGKIFSPKKTIPEYNFKKQTRNVKFKDDKAKINGLAPSETLLTYYFDNVTTMYQLYLHGERVSRKRKTKTKKKK
jgi:hypothetical protein